MSLGDTVMKKVATRIFWIAVVITVITHAVMGIKLLDDNYEITIEAYIGAACFFIIFVCSIIRVLENKCPHCGRTILDSGEYCSHCGKKIKNALNDKR